LLIAIAGPYSDPDTEIRKRNLEKLNSYAVQIYLKGHIPVIGVNAALHVTELLDKSDRRKAMMDISLALVEKCDAILFTGESPGANMERDLMAGIGKKIFYKPEEIPIANDV